jgi:hypothetical protein
MVRVLPADSHNTPFLVAAIETASRIAHCETSEAARRAATMWGLSRAIDDFPPSLYSSSRYFIDCIDCVDVPIPSSSSFRDSPAMSQSTGLQERLTCTLFLFSDVVVIAKRNPGLTGGKALAGLDDLTVLDRAFASSGRTTPSKMRNRSMTFKGSVPLANICATDLGGNGTAPSSVQPLFITKLILGIW